MWICGCWLKLLLWGCRLLEWLKRLSSRIVVELLLLPDRWERVLAKQGLAKLLRDLARLELWLASKLLLTAKLTGLLGLAAEQSSLL